MDKQTIDAALSAKPVEPSVSVEDLAMIISKTKATAYDTIEQALATSPLLDGSASSCRKDALLCVIAAAQAILARYNVTPKA